MVATHGTIQQRLASLLSNNMKQECSELCGLVRAQMLLVVVRPNTLLLHGTRDKDAYIQQRPNMEDGGVMSLLAL